MLHEIHGKEMERLFGANVKHLAIEQLQSDEESTDSEEGEREKSDKLRVVRPTWRSARVKKKLKKKKKKIQPNSILIF